MLDSVKYVCENRETWFQILVSHKNVSHTFLKRNDREYTNFAVFPCLSRVRSLQFLLWRPKVKHKASWQTTRPWRVSLRRSPSFTPTARSGARFRGFVVWHGLQWLASRYLASFTSALGSWSVPQQNNFTEQISATSRRWDDEMIHDMPGIFFLQVWVQTEILPESWQVWCILYADCKCLLGFFRIFLPPFVTLTQLAPDLDYLKASSQKRQEAKKRTYWKVGQWGVAQYPGTRVSTSSIFRKLVRWVL